MKTMVFGAGGWGIALSMVAYEHGHEVTLWSFSEEEIRSLRLHNENRQRLPGISLPDGILLTNDISPAAEADYIILAVAVAVVAIVAKLSQKKDLREWLYGKTALSWALSGAIFVAILLFGAYSIGYDASQFIYTIY